MFIAMKSESGHTTHPLEKSFLPLKLDSYKKSESDYLLKFILQTTRETLIGIHHKSVHTA